MYAKYVPSVVFVVLSFKIFVNYTKYFTFNSRIHSVGPKRLKWNPWMLCSENLKTWKRKIWQPAATIILGGHGPGLACPVRHWLRPQYKVVGCIWGCKMQLMSGGLQGHLATLRATALHHTLTLLLSHYSLQACTVLQCSTAVHWTSLHWAIVYCSALY